MSVPYSSYRTPSIGDLNNVKINNNTLATGDVVKYNSANQLWENGVGGEVPLTFSTGLTRTVNTITNNLSTGVVGGQTAIGGTGVTDILTLKGTTGNGTSGSPAIQAIVGNNGATTALTVLNSGNVGIGTTAPGNTLNVKGGLVPLKVEPTGSSTDGVNLTLGYTGLTFNTTAPAYKTFAITNSLTGDALGLMNFNNGGSTRMTIANAGNVGIGTTAPTSKLHIEEPTTTAGTAGINVQKTGTITGNSYGVLSQTTGTATTNYAGFFTASGATNNYGLVVSAGNVGIGTTAPAYQLQVGTGGTEMSIGGDPTSNASGRLKFINSNSVTNWQISTNDSVSGAFEITPSTAVGGNNFVTTPAMKISSVGAVTISNLGSGTVQATAGVLSIVSDARLKDEDGFITDALTKVLELKPRYFKWKTDNLAGLPSSVRQLGFFAQEVQDVLGEEVVNTPPEGGNYGIHDRGIIAMLVKALQEQQVIIDLLDNRLKVLETK
jgi:hypothetical protein